MIQDPEYVKKVHKALTDKVDGFNKSLEEFSASLNDDKYVSNVYKALSDKIDGFSKTPEQFKSLVYSQPQKKNSNSTGTTPQKVSSTKPQQKNTTSVGEKPKKTTPSGSSFGGSNNMYGGLNVLPPAPQPSYKKPIPVMGEDIQLTTKKDGVKTDVSGNVIVDTTKKTLGIRDEDKFKEYKQVLEKVDDRLDVAIKEKVSPRISYEKLKSELDEYEFSDVIKEGLRNTYNSLIGNPLSIISSKLGSEKDFYIKKGNPLEEQKKRAEKEFAEQGVSVSPQKIQERAEELYIQDDVLKQKLSITDEFFSSIDKGHLTQKQLEVVKKAEVFDKNQEIKSKYLLYRENDSKINALNNFILEINKKGAATEEDKIEYKRLLSLATDAEETNKQLSTQFASDLEKLKTDEEKLELLKYNYNDLEAFNTFLASNITGLLGGGLKLLGETEDFLLEKVGLEGESIRANAYKSIGGEMISASEEAKKPFRAMSIEDINNLGDLGSWFTQTSSSTLTSVAAMYFGGGFGLAALSMGSGGQRIAELEKEESLGLIPKQSNGEKVLAGWFYAGASYFPEKFGTFRYLQNLRKTFSTLNSESRRLFKDSFLKSSAKIVTLTGGQSFIEGGEEGVTSLIEDVTDIYLSGKELNSNDIARKFKNATAAGIASGGTMSLGGNLSLMYYSNLNQLAVSKDIKESRRLLIEMESITEELNTNTSLLDSDKVILNRKLNDLTEKLFENVTKTENNVGNMSLNEISKVIDINNEQAKIKEEYDNLRSSNISKSIKDSKVKELDAKFVSLEAIRNDILNGKYNVLSFITEEESTKLKLQAAEELKSEAIASGIEEGKVNIKEEEITKRAIDNYEKQSKETAVEKPTKEGPTGQENVQDVTATQGQQDKVVQEEINSIREDFDNNNLNAISINVSRDGFSGEFLDDYDYLAEGSEHIVYRSKDGKTVIKIGEPYGSNEGFMPRVEDALRINRIIGDGSLRLIGYYENNGIKNPVYSQNFVEGDVLSQEEVSNHLESKGFVSIGKDKFAIKIDDKIYEISDTSDNFIKDKDGNVFAVDAGIFELKESDLTNDQISKINNTTSEKTKQVEELRQQELVDFKEQVENSEEFITDGKIDAKKVSESDNAKAKEIYAKYDKLLKPLLTNIKTQEDAIQKQSTSEGVLRPEQSKMGLQEVVEGDQETEVTTEEVKSEEEVKLQDAVAKASERLSKAYDAYKNIGITFDPEGNWKKDKELVTSLIGYAVSNIKLGAYNSAKLIEDLKGKGIEITKEAAEFIFNKASKSIPKMIDKTIGVNKNKPTEQKRINKAYGIGIADQKLENKNKKEKAKEVKDVKSETSKLNKDRKSAIKNVKGGKFGSLTNTSKSNKETILEHETKKVKVLNFAMLLPNIVKKAVTPELYEKYSNALSALSGRGLAIETKVTAQEVADLYDQIIDDYTNFSEIQNAVLNNDLSILNNNQNKFYNDNKDLFINPRAEKEVDEEDLAEKREELENEVISLIPSIKNTPKDYEAKSMSFKISSLLADINTFDLKLLSNSQLENLRRVLDAMSLGEDIPTFANDIYQEILSNRNMALSSNIAEKYNKTGFNRIPLRRTLTKMSDAIRGFFGENSLIKESNIKSRATRYPLVLIDTANKIFGILPTYADAIMNNYKAIPIYNYILSAIEKGEGALASRNEEVAEVFEKVNEKLSKNTKDIDESYRKIHFAFLQIQAWANPGNKKVKNGVVSFSENFNNSDSPYSDKMKSQYREFVNKYKGYSFIKSDDNIIVLDNNGADVTTEYFSREEMNAYKAIRKELDNQKARAEETSLFNNKNALPFVNEYFPENNFSKKASAQSINEDPLSNNFSNNPSVKSKNLLEKTAVAHPVAHNPFAVSLISIKGTEMQYQLLNPIQVARKTMKKIIEDNNKAILESTGKEKSKYNELAKVYDNIDSAIETLVEHLKGANIGKPDALDNISDLLTNTFYVGALASGIRTAADLSLNYQHLITAEPSAVQTGFKERVNIKNAVNKVDSKDPDKVYRQILKYIDASQINRVMGVVNLTSVRSEFQSEGANPDITRKGVESDASKVFKKVIGIASPLTKSAKTINETLMSVSDNMPALNFFIGVFSNEFKQASGKDFDWEKAAENSSEYALENSDAMNYASTIANYKLATYLGSKNVSSKSPAVVSSMRGQDGKILSKLKNRANYIFRQFTMSSTGQFLGALNTLFEVESAKDVSKQVRIMVGSGLRTSLYFAVSQSIINGIAGLILGDDEDEDVMKKNSDELSNDDEFIKNLYTIKENYAKFEEDVKKLDPESEFDIAEVFGTDGKLKKDILDLLKDKRFRELFDANYRFYAREMFSLKINTLAKDNGLMKSYDEGDVKGIINRIDSGNKNISQSQIEMHLAYLNSEYGRSSISQEDRENYIEKIEEYLVNTKYYLLYNKVTSSDEFDETTPEGVFKTSALYITIDNLLKHRDNSFESNFEKGVVETGVNLVTGVRGTFPQKGVSYVVELINRKHKESTRGYYDFEKDRYNYATPDIMLSDKDVDLGKITESLTPPEITVLLRAFQRNKETDAALIAFRLPGVSDINRISGGIKKDEIYQNARGKFVENEIKKFLERKLYLTEEEKEEKAKKEAEYNSKLVQDKNKVRRVTK